MLTGCGIYSTRGTLPAHINTISISPIQNESSEFLVAEQMSEIINRLMMEENILKISSQDIADSQLNIIVKSVTDMPYTYSVENDESERVDEWRITIKASMIWYDLKKDEPLVEKSLSGFGVYGPGVDIGSDGIDNDNDRLVDGEDSDEYGSPRESALRIAIEKMTELIINEITSTW
jgi:hypothetical protein